MQKLISLIILSFLHSAAHSQIGFKLKAVEAFVGEKQVLNTRQAGNYIIQDIRTGIREVIMIMYNKDSVAVMVASGLKDSAYSDEHVAALLSNNLPEFIVSRTAVKDTVTYYHDTAGKMLFVVNHSSNKTKSAIIGFGFVTDPVIIEQWLQGVKFKE